MALTDYANTLSRINSTDDESHDKKIIGLYEEDLTTFERLHPVAAPGKLTPTAMSLYWSSSSSPVTGNDSIWIARGVWSDRTFTRGVATERTPDTSANARRHSPRELSSCLALAQ